MINVRACLVLLCLGSFSHAQVDNSSKPDLAKFNAEVSPVLQKHCVACHGPEKARGKITLHDADPNLRSAKSADLWAKVVEQISLGEMPPSEKPRLQRQEIETITNWVRVEQARAGREVALDPTQLPGFGNYVDHKQLFTMPAESKAATVARLWRISPFIFKDQVNALARTPVLIVKPNQGGNGLHPSLPFLTPTHSFRDHAGPHGFENATTELLFDMAWRVADYQMKGKRVPREFSDALAANPPTEAQLQALLRMQFGLALQRDPAPEEIKSLLSLAAKTQKDAGTKEVVQSLLAAVLMKPEAMFRAEIGNGKTDAFGRSMLSPRELSFAISFALTDDLPDVPLRDALAKEKLTSRDDVRREITRLFEDPRIKKPRILRFFQEYFEYPAVTRVFKDTRNANAIFANDRVYDADRLILHILNEDRDVLKQLLTTDKVFVYANGFPVRDPVIRRARLFYLPDFGLPTDWNEKVSQPLIPPSGKRSGILTHPAWLMAFSDNEKSQAIQRGLWVRTKLLGGTVPDVPIGVNAQFSDDHTITLREKMKVTREAYCWKCHQRMDELGLPFEQFDGFGKYRTEERVQSSNKDATIFKDVPLDTSGAITLTGDPSLDGPVKDPYEYMERLANSRLVRQVFIRHAFRYWMGRNETLDDAPTLIEAEKAYDTSGGSMKGLITSLLTSDSFLFRRLENTANKTGASR